jgi:hypothetical protein
MTLEPTTGIPMRGPDHRLSCYLKSNVLNAAVDSSVKGLHATLIRADGSRIVLTPNGYESSASGRLGVQFFLKDKSSETERARAIELLADHSIDVDSIVWWTGDVRQIHHWIDL